MAVPFIRMQGSPPWEATHPHSSLPCSATWWVQDLVELHTACAGSWLWLTPYFGLRATAAIDAAIACGWSSGELAVRFTEAYATLVGRGRYSQVACKFVRVVRAALVHPLR